MTLAIGVVLLAAVGVLVASGLMTRAPSSPQAAGPTITPRPTTAPTPTPERPPTPSATAGPTPAPITPAYSPLSAVEWAKVIESPDAYAGQAYKVWACVRYAKPYLNEGFFGLASFGDSESFVNGTLVHFAGLGGVVAGDVLVIDAIVHGEFTYGSGDDQITVPSFFVSGATKAPGRQTACSP